MADIQNKIKCNVAMLVDSMVPLDKIMVGTYLVGWRNDCANHKI